MFVEEIVEESPLIGEETKYWLVRSGIESKYFEEFSTNNQIALGWDLVNNIEIFKDDVNSDRIRSVVTDQYQDYLTKLSNMRKTNISRRITDITNKIWRFVNELKAGDIVLTPGKDEILIGEVLSDVYVVQGVYNKKDENLDDAIIGELNKVRNVKWLKRIKRDELEPNIKLNINVNHGISQIINPQVITEVNRSIYNFYIKDNEAHSIIMVKNQEEIDFEQYAKFIGHTYSIYNILRGSNSEEKLTIKTNIQSPGPIEFIGAPLLVSSLTISLVALIKNKSYLLDKLNPQHKAKLEEYKENIVEEEVLQDYDFPFDGEF